MNLMLSVLESESPPGALLLPPTQAGGGSSLLSCLEPFSPQPALRICKTCGVEKPETDFRPCNRSPLNRERTCKACRKEQAAERYRKNPELLIEIRRRYSETARAKSKKWYRENLARAKAQRKRYAAANRGAIEAKRSEWRKAHKDVVEGYRAKWETENPGKYREAIRASRARRRAREVNAPGWRYTTAQHISWRWQMWGGKCYICGEPATQTDHVKPLSRGGSHWPANLRPACEACNNSKLAKPLSEFLKYAEVVKKVGVS